VTLKLTELGYASVGKCNHIEISRRFNLIHEKNGLLNPYLLFARDAVRPERVTTSGRRATKRKG